MKELKRRRMIICDFYSKLYSMPEGVDQEKGNNDSRSLLEE